MTTRRLNNFLDAEVGAESDSQGYISAEEDRTRKGGSSAKRRKVEAEHNQDEQSIGDDDSNIDEGEEPKILGDRSSIASKKVHKSPLPNISTPFTKKNLVATTDSIKKSGVVYLSRLPPFMKPSKLRSLLSPYGTINRIFLSPEDASAHTRRVRNGGNKKRSFTDGWVEFVRKIDAKRACELLNGQIIGGKKGTFYHDDIWNLLYLKGFKWRNLTEQIAAENAERASRMRAEIGRMTKENREFVGNIERAKMLEGMERKKQGKKGGQGGEDVDDVEGTPIVDKTPKRMKGERPRHFKQLPPAPKKNSGEQSDEVKRVLSKIF